ncbi:hypothetical protein ACQKWADRAFT_190615 [Trichoderma austrokoningii]
MGVCTVCVLSIFFFKSKANSTARSQHRPLTRRTPKSNTLQNWHAKILRGAVARCSRPFSELGFSAFLCSSFAKPLRPLMRRRAALSSQNHCLRQIVGRQPWRSQDMEAGGLLHGKHAVGMMTALRGDDETRKKR